MATRGASVGKKCHRAFYAGLCRSASVKIKPTDGMRRRVAPWAAFALSLVLKGQRASAWLLIPPPRGRSQAREW